MLTRADLYPFMLRPGRWVITDGATFSKQEYHGQREAMAEARRRNELNKEREKWIITNTSKAS